MFMEQVQTLDISPMGARLKGISHLVKMGSVVGIQNGDSQGRFEVIWVGERGTDREGQIGVRCIQIGQQTKKSVLYIDDQEFELERRKPLLQAFGYDVHTASTAEEAFSLLNKVHFQAVMVDQPFPGVNDVTFLEQIKKTQPDTKLILVSAFPSQVVERSLQMADSFLHKGQNQNKLIAAIEQLIGPGHTLKWPITRTIQRYKVVVPLAIRVLRSGKSVEMVANSTDLSEGGVGVDVANGELVAGEIVTVEFSLPTAPHSLKLYAMVRHRKLNQYGLQFIDLSGEHQQAIRDLCDVLVPMDVPH
jgi:DNA-binding NarL/FixJ family response regulator